MAIRVPTPAAAAEKWSRVTPGRQQDYTAGVAAAGNEWQEAVNRSEDAWNAGVAQAAAEDRYMAGVAGKAARYSQRAQSVGGPRWAQGVQNARADYERAIAPIFNAISSLTLPPRAQRGAPQNLQRVQVVVEALRAVR